MASKIIQVKVPDIGGAEDVAIIEVNVAVGDHLELDDALITLESDKATMDVPAPAAGTVKALQVKLGDKLSEGDVILDLEVEGDAPADSADAAPAASSDTSTARPESTVAASSAAASPQVVPIYVPDIGGAEAVPIIEISVQAGDELALDDTLLTLESDKATMDVPAPYAGKLISVDCKVGDKLSEGDLIGKIETSAAVVASDTAQSEAAPDSASSPAQASSSAASASSEAVGLDWDDDETAIVEPNFYAAVNVYAGPAVRRLARELGVDLTLVKEKSGDKGRITKNDLKAYVKARLQGGGGSGAGMSVAAAPAVDFSKFGEIETQDLSRIQKISGTFLHRNWVTIPHVTQFAETDITELEAFRQEKKAEALKEGIRLTPLAFIMKALEAALKKFPKFNSSLDPSGEKLIIKKYCHIGVAVDTPNGLVVAVIRDVDQKGVYQLAKEMAEISLKAREKGLSPSDMQGGCMTISSLGGIGGTAFTPIVNAPEVAILGVSKAQHKPVLQADKTTFAPRLMLPLCLSYDHRVIDGADGARFITYLSSCLSDLENLIL